MAQDRSAALLAKLPGHAFDSRDFIRRKQIALDTLVGEDLSLEKGASIPVRRPGSDRQELLPIRSLSAR